MLLYPCRRYRFVFLTQSLLNSYPTYMPILQRAIELWYHVPACTTPVLKLMAELVHNRYSLRPAARTTRQLHFGESIPRCHISAVLTPSGCLFHRGN